MLKTVLMIALPIVLLAAVALITVKVAKKTTVRKGVITHVVSLVVAISLCAAFTCVVSAQGNDDKQTSKQVSVSAQAEADDTAADAETTTSSKAVGDGLVAVGAALAIGLAGIGGGFAVGSGATAAIGATAEDPQIFGKAIIFVVLGEAIALYGFVASLLLIFKI